MSRLNQEKEIAEDTKKNDGINSIKNRGFFTESKKNNGKKMKETREVRSEEIKNKKEAINQEIPFILDLPTIPYIIHSESNDSLCEYMK